jgi:thioesterase domain-containing protein/acyl carrier protein
LKEIINRGGEKISPREIDEVLLEHPAVAQAVAFAVPHTTLGEDLAAAVVLKEDTAVEQIEIRKYAFEHLADFKVPSQILIVDEIPKGATGKLQRIGLHGKLESEIRGEFVPPRNEVEVAIAMIWNEVLGNEQVGVYDNFFQLGGDSLSATQLVSRLRSIFQVEIPLGSIFREPTISEQAVVIESKGEILADGKRSLIAIQLDGSKRPLFCIPGILGNVFTDLGALSEHLGSDQPFYGFQDGVHNPSKIESLAENYINEMREVQPQGPYNLAGICSGAVVAYEMANQLERYGEKVDFLAMVEPSPHRTPGLRTYILFIVGEFRRLLRRTPFQAQKISKLDLNQRFANVRLKIKKFANSLALRRYKAKIYPGQVHIFLTEETMKQQSKRRRGWIDWIQGGTQVHPIPGTHNTITGFEDTPIESNHMKVLADQFYLFMSSDNATALSTGQKRID